MSGFHVSFSCVFYPGFFVRLSSRFSIRSLSRPFFILEEKHMNQTNIRPATSANTAGNDASAENDTPAGLPGSASGRWRVVRHGRLPHRDGLPLSTDGGDSVER
jgi:hypothetical protein